MIKKICSFFAKIKTFFTRKVSVAFGVVAAIYAAIVGFCTKVLFKVLKSNKAEAYVDTGVKILIAVVVGALLLAGLYALFGDTIMPTVTEKVEELFNYAG